jgi:hypothetical protein
VAIVEEYLCLKMLRRTLPSRLMVKRLKMVKLPMDRWTSHRFFRRSNFKKWKGKCRKIELNFKFRSIKSSIRKEYVDSVLDLIP